MKKTTKKKAAPAKRGRGAEPGHPGWGGRPPGAAMPCGWGCGEILTARQMRAHFAICPNRPEVKKKE